MIASLMLAGALFAAQDPVATGTFPTDLPVLAPATLAADCGGFLSVPAFCVTARMDETGALAETYLEQLSERGWIAADGDNNRVILIKRREGGGCDGLQMVAFYDTTKPQTAEAPAFLGFAYIPGDICAAPAGAAQ